MTAEDFRTPTFRRGIQMREGEEVVRAPARYELSGPWGRVPLSTKQEPNALSFRAPWRPAPPPEFSPDTEGGILVAHNETLKYTRYVATGPKGETIFEMHLSDEALGLMRDVGWKKIRTLFEEDFEYVRKEPFGSRSLDPQLDDSTSHRLRTINQASVVIEQVLHLPIAIKGTGLGPFYNWQEHENLTEQYVFMRRLQQSSEKFPPDLKEILSVCKMYGVIRAPAVPPEGANDKHPRFHEWLIMERVENGEQMDTHLVNIMYIHIGGPPDQPDPPEPFFDPEKHPDLLRAVSRFGLAYDEASYTAHDGSYEALAGALWNTGLRPRLTDLAGRNILVTKMTDGRNHYTLIDQRDKAV